MRNISDEKLMAYVDGELTGDERAEVETAMKTDPTIESRMAVFKSTGDQLAGLYDDAMRRPVPDHLIDMILSAPDDRARSTVAAPNWLDRIGVSDVFKNFSLAAHGYSGAVAFSVLLLATGFAGWQLKSNNLGHSDQDMLANFNNGRMLAQGQLSKALNGIGSGTKLTWSGENNSSSSIKPVFTFRTASGSFCRQYEMVLSSGEENSTGEGFSGVACRGTSGQWQIRAHMAARPAPDAGNKTVPASGAGSTVIDKVVDQLIEGDVLGSEAETGLIKDNWKETR